MENMADEKDSESSTTMEAAVARLCRPTTYRVAPHPDPITETQYRTVLDAWTPTDRKTYGRVHAARMAAYLLHELDNEEACEFAFSLVRYHGNAPQIRCKLPDVDPTPEELARAKLTEDDLVVIGAEGALMTMLMIGASRYVNVLFGLRTHPPEVTSVPHVRYHIRHTEVLRFRAGFAHAVAVWLFKDQPWYRAVSPDAVSTLETHAVQRYFRYLDGYLGIPSLVQLLRTPFTMMGTRRAFELFGRCNEERRSDYLRLDPEKISVLETKTLHLPPCLNRMLKRIQDGQPVYHSPALWVLTRQYPELMDTIPDPTRRIAESSIAARAIEQADAAVVAAAKDPKQFKRKDYSCNYMWAIKQCPLQWASAIEELPVYRSIKAGNVAEANAILTDCTKGVNVARHCAKLCAVPGSRVKYVNNPKTAIYYTT